MKKNYDVILIILSFIILFFLVLKAPIINRFKNNGDLIINEVVASSSSDDVIELYNGSNNDINLKGYYISDDSLNLKKYTFEDITIKSKDYLVLYANGKSGKDKDKINLNFKLKKSGEVLTLCDKDLNVLSRIYYTDLIKDTSYGYSKDKYVYFYNPTIGSKNEGILSENPIEIGKSKIDLRITEYMLENNSINKSFDNNYYPMIEIYNNEEKDVNLKDFYLSNSSKNKYVYKFPEITIKSKSYLVVYASGLNNSENNQVHTNFKLNEKDNVIILSDNYKQLVDEVSINKVSINNSYGLYKDNWYLYSTPTMGSENTDNYIEDVTIKKDIIINEVEVIDYGFIELKNISDTEVDLSNYTISDKSGVNASLKGFIIKPGEFLTIYQSDEYSISKGKLYTGFKINNSNEILYLYKNGVLIDKFNVGRMVSGVSKGRNKNLEYAYYKDITIGRENSSNEYKGYSKEVSFSLNNLYVEKGTKVELEGDNVYYTTDGSFPTVNSSKYSTPIEINKDTTIKAINVIDGLIESEVTSRTYIVSDKHDIAVMSISGKYSDLLGGSGIITNYTSNALKKVSAEFYESDGAFGVGFISDMKLSGMDSRKQPQKSMSLYLRKEYGLQTVSYPFFDNYNLTKFDSLLLRNAGEDPRRIRLQDAVQTRVLKGQMDIDMQEYRPVAVYINDEYYGMLNLRERMNEDYVVNKYDIEKGETNFYKYATQQKGNTDEYKALVSYINTHNMANSEYYEYVKSQVDIQELINYWVVQSYFGNTDLGNIRYYKTSNGKFRWMIYDQDWSLWSSTTSFAYPIKGGSIPAATALDSSVNISRKLYQNSEYKDLYLKTFAKHLKETFNDMRMNKIVDELAKEVENEMPKHISKWGIESGITSMSVWKNNLDNYKTMISKRYKYVKQNVKQQFGLSEEEYRKYFGDIE